MQQFNSQGLNILVCASFLFFSTGCSAWPPVPFYVHANVESAEKEVDSSVGNRAKEDLGQIIVMLALSGGGYRATALSFGVLQGLHEIQIDRGDSTTPDKPGSFWEEIDFVSGISGGAITAAFFALNHRSADKFANLKQLALKRDAEFDIFVVRTFLYPWNWFPLLFTHFSQTHLAADFYDSTLFEGKTFGALDSKPRLIIGGTELGGQERFEFTEKRFECLGSDWKNFKISQAVAASAAFPLVFPPLPLKNFNASVVNCDGTRSYVDHIGRSYFHISDGGIKDNTGILALLYRLKDSKDQDRIRILYNSQCIKGILLISVDAAAHPGKDYGRTAGPLGRLETLRTVVDVIHNEAHGAAVELANDLPNDFPQQTDGYKPHTKHIPINFHRIRDHAFESDVSSGPDLLDSLDGIRTGLSLTDEQRETLISSGKLAAKMIEDDIKLFFQGANMVQTQNTCKPL